MRSTKAVAGLAAGMAAILAVTLGGAQASFAETANGNNDPHHMDHVFMIIMENRSRQQILDPNNPGTPHIRALANEYGSALNYYGVTQPSQPNYIALTSGSTWGSAANNNEQRTMLDHTNIVDQFEEHNVSWKAYMESAPYPGYTGGRYMDPNGSGAYPPWTQPVRLVPEHLQRPAAAQQGRTADPAVDRHRQEQGAGVRLDHPEPVPRHAHGPGCDTLNETQLEQLGDNFIDQWVKTIMNSKAWTSNSTIWEDWT